MEALAKQHRHFLPFPLKVKPSGLPPEDLDTQKFHLLIVVLFCNCF